MIRSAWLTGLVIVLLAAACSGPVTPRSKLDGLLAQAVAAAEGRDTGEFMELIAPDYRDARGRERDALRNFLRGLFLRYGSIHVDTRILELRQLNSLGGEVELSVGLAGQRGDNNPLWSLGAQRYRLRLELVADGPSDPFRVLRANWQPEHSRQ